MRVPTSDSGTERERERVCDGEEEACLGLALLRAQGLVLAGVSSSLSSFFFFTLALAFLQTPQIASFRYRLNNDSGFTCSSSSAASEEEPLVVRRRRSDRLFFEPGGDTRSIIEEPKATATAVGEEKEPPFEDSVAVAVESRNPYSDFRRSMEEVMAA